MYKHNRRVLSKPCVELPSEFLQLVEDETKVLLDVATYHRYIHPAFPIGISSLYFPAQLTISAL